MTMTLAETCYDEQQLRRRILAEFREMPGMRLTLPQAARLFSMDPERCGRMLAALVEAGDLSRTGSVFGSPRGDVAACEHGRVGNLSH